MRFKIRVTQFYRRILTVLLLLMAVHSVFLVLMLFMYLLFETQLFLAILLTHSLIYLILAIDNYPLIRKALLVKNMWLKKVNIKKMVAMEKKYATQAIQYINIRFSRYVYLFLFGLIAILASFMIQVGDFQVGSGLGLIISTCSGAVVYSSLKHIFNFYIRDMQAGF